MIWLSFIVVATTILHNDNEVTARHHHSGNSHKPEGDFSLWIDRQQIKMFSGEYSFTIFLM